MRLILWVFLFVFQVNNKPAFNCFYSCNHDTCSARSDVWHSLSLAVNCVIIAARTQKWDIAAMFENKSRFMSCVQRLLWWSGHQQRFEKKKKKKNATHLSRDRHSAKPHVAHSHWVSVFFLSHFSTPKLGLFPERLADLNC